MCMSTLADKTGSMMSFAVDPFGMGYGDKLAKGTTGKISSKLSEEGQRMGFGGGKPTSGPATQAPQQVETRAARQGSAILS